MSAQEPSRCGRCGRDPALGYATINGVRYCHDGLGDECDGRTCYELASGRTVADGLRSTIAR